MSDWFNYPGDHPDSDVEEWINLSNVCSLTMRDGSNERLEIKLQFTGGNTAWIRLGMNDAARLLRKLGWAEEQLMYPKLLLKATGHLK